MIQIYNSIQLQKKISQTFSGTFKPSIAIDDPLQYPIAMYDLETHHYCRNEPAPKKDHAHTCTCTRAKHYASNKQAEVVALFSLGHQTFSFRILGRYTPPMMMRPRRVHVLAVFFPCVVQPMHSRTLHFESTSSWVKKVRDRLLKWKRNVRFFRVRWFISDLRRNFQEMALFACVQSAAISRNAEALIRICAFSFRFVR